MMQIQPFIKIFTLIITVSLLSCSPRLVSPPLVTVQPFSLEKDFDKLLPQSEISTEFFVPELIRLNIPEIAIMEPFTKREQNDVRMKDNRLFERGGDLSIDLSKISDEAFVFPLPKANIISAYGTRRGRSHTGVDLKTGSKDTIYAAFDGVVRVSNRGRGYGNVIVIRHYNGIETVYSHNSKNMVRSGDRVAAGTPISIVGRTGRASTEHLHFEVRINGQHFDPNLLIDFNSHQLKNNRIVFTPNDNGKIAIDAV